MNAELFNRFRQLELPKGEYAIFGSGPLAIRGIIPLSNDLDILCKDTVWEIVAQIGAIEFLPEYSVNIVSLCDGAITFGQKWGIGRFDVDELIDTAEIIDGLPFVRIEHVIRYKTIRSNTKDLLHLKALEAAGFVSVQPQA